jgi:hypothetical protein
VHNTVGNENIGDDDAGVVHEDASIVDGDGQFISVHCRESSSVLQTRAVAGFAANNSVVGKNVGNLLSGEVTKTRADSLESSVVGCEDGDVRCVVDSAEQLGRLERTAKRSQPSST